MMNIEGVLDVVVDIHLQHGRVTLHVSSQDQVVRTSAFNGDTIGRRIGRTVPIWTKLQCFLAGHFLSRLLFLMLIRLWIRIRTDPNKIERWIRIRINVISWIRHAWKMSLFQHFLKVLSLLEARIRTRICIKVTSRIRTSK
jgi:hypothetical protein